MKSPLIRDYQFSNLDIDNSSQNRYNKIDNHSDFNYVHFVYQFVYNDRFVYVTIFTVYHLVHG